MRGFEVEYFQWNQCDGSEDEGGTTVPGDSKVDQLEGMEITKKGNRSNLLRLRAETPESFNTADFGSKWELGAQLGALVPRRWNVRS